MQRKYCFVFVLRVLNKLLSVTAVRSIGSLLDSSSFCSRAPRQKHNKIHCLEQPASLLVMQWNLIIKVLIKQGLPTHVMHPSFEMPNIFFCEEIHNKNLTRVFSSGVTLCLDRTLKLRLLLDKRFSIAVQDRIAENLFYLF